MKQNLTAQDKKTHMGKYLIFPVAAAVLAVAGGLLYCFRNTRPEVQPVMSETNAESKILETNLPAAASVQTEISDSISESVKPTVSETFTESIFIQETAVSENIPEESVFSETASAVTTETESTATASETETEPPTQEETVTESQHITESTEVTTETSAPAVTETIPETATETTALPEKITYHSVLASILKNQSFQDDDFEIFNESDIAENEFAVYDIDNDGREELIIRWPNTASASVSGVIYGYDNEGTIYKKLKTTPYMRFYSNGMIEADNLYKSLLSGDFWGYTMYQYDAENGIYKETASVEAWSKEAMSRSENQQAVYPDYADFSESGYVYLISRSEDENTELSDPLDVTSYQAWHEACLNDAFEISLPFRQFTESNIENIQ